MGNLTKILTFSAVFSSKINGTILRGGKGTIVRTMITFHVLQGRHMKIAECNVYIGR